MADELSTILAHIERISELDLEGGVPPTTHVVEVATRCARTSRARSLPRDVVLDAAPATQDGGFLVPSPQA